MNKRLLIVLLVLAPVIAGAALKLFNAESGSAAAGFKKLGIVRVEGEIFESESVVRQLQQMRSDNLIAGVLLRVNSPGGATAPSQEIYNAVSGYRGGDKPVVVSMGNVAASGGYYISAPATKIFADPGTLTGSIGVIMSFPIYKDLAKKIGVDMQTLKSGGFKDISNPYRAMTAEERVMLQQLLEDTHDQFIADVALSRSLNRDSLELIADGRIFTGRQAIKVGLVDTLGGYESALAYLRHITGLGPAARLVDKRETTIKMREWLYNEMMHVFPSLFRVFSPIGTYCLAVFG